MQEPLITIKIAVFTAVPAYMIIGIVRGILSRRRERRQLHQRVHEAIEKITEDGKIEAPKGRCKPRRWGRRWLDYSNSLPVPGKRYQMSGRELPGIDWDD